MITCCYGKYKTLLAYISAVSSAVSSVNETKNKYTNHIICINVLECIIAHNNILRILHVENIICIGICCFIC